MKSFTVHQGTAAVLNRVNVDTDQIIPKQFLKRVERTGFGQFLFFDWRFQPDGSLNEAFELNQPEAQGATVLIAGHNFGCGSSREHAPWALEDYGFRVIIAPSFADIFYNNCVKNGILPVRLREEEVHTLMDQVAAGDAAIAVDLLKQQVRQSDSTFSFTIDSYWKEMLVNGRDEIGLTLQLEEKITAFEKRRR